MDFKDSAVGLVQPGQDEKVVAGHNSFESGTSKVFYVEPRVGCAFRTLFRGFAAFAEGRADHANRAEAPGPAIFAARVFTACFTEWHRCFTYLDRVMSCGCF